MCFFDIQFMMIRIMGGKSSLIIEIRTRRLTNKAVTLLCNQYAVLQIKIKGVDH